MRKLTTRLTLAHGGRALAGRRQRRGTTVGRAREGSGEGEGYGEGGMCGVFGGRRGRTGVGIVGRGACGALTKTCVWRFAGKAGECEATERGGGEAMASDADDGDGDAARRTAGVSDRQARAGMASAGKRQHQVPLIGIGQCHAMTASNQVNFYTYCNTLCERMRRRR